jgi:fumarylacetoacetate (FAA) hydrolase
MNFHFGQLIAHAARTRRLTRRLHRRLGHGQQRARSAGSGLHRRAPRDREDRQGEIRTGFMRFGDRVRMQALFDDGRPGPFGVIDQRVVAPAGAI